MTVRDIERLKRTYPVSYFRQRLSDDYQRGLTVRMAQYTGTQPVVSINDALTQARARKATFQAA